MKVLLPVLTVAAVATAIPAWFWQPGTAESDVDAAAVTDLHFGEDVDWEQKTADELNAWLDSIGSVSVAKWNDEEVTIDNLEVKRGEAEGDEQVAAWVIASRYGYPADAEGKIGEVLGYVLGVPKGLKVAEDAGRHASLGVVDPTDQTTADTEGRGIRVTVKDRADKPIVDVVVGNQVEGKSGSHYVREIGSNDVFIGELASTDPDPEKAQRYRSANFSARFIDWVRANPLQLTKADIRKVSIDKYSITADMKLKDKETVSLDKPAGAAAWTADKIPDGKELDTAEIDKILNKVTNLKLADIHPFNRSDLELRGLGFFLQGQKIGASMEGNIKVQAKDGFVYNLFFGMPMGKGTKVAGATDSDADENASDRLMFITVEYQAGVDETVPKPPVAPKPAEGEEAVSDEAQEAHTKALAEHTARVRKHDAQQRRLWQQRQLKYIKFFHLIRDDDFQTLRPNIAGLFKVAEKKEEEEAAKPGDLPTTPPPAAP